MQGDEEGLIALPDDVGPGRRRRLSKPVQWFVAASFLAVLVATAAVDTLRPAPEITLVGQELVDAQIARRNRGIRNGTWTRWVEQELRIRSSVRRALAPWWTALLIRFGHKGSNDIVVGDDGWIFLRRRVTVPSGPIQRHVTPTVNAMSALARRAERAGIDLVAVPIPRKPVAAPSKLPRGVDARPELEAAVTSGLESAGVDCVDLVAAWRGLSDEEVYLPGDSHWAIDGQIAAARACVAARPEIRGDELEATFEKIPRRYPATGNWVFAGVPPDHPAHRLVAPPPGETVAFQPEAAARSLQERVATSDVALAGTSYSASFEFPRLLQALAGRRIVDFSSPGAPLGEPVRQLLEATKPGERPSTVFVEFPITHVLEFSGEYPAPLRAMGLCFVVCELGPTSDLEHASSNGTRAFTDNPRGVRLTHDSQAIVASGDGVASLLVRADGAAGSAWQFRSEALKFDFTWPEGAQELLLPLVSKGGPSAFFEFIARDDRAGAAALDGRLVTDLDLAASVAAERVGSEGGLHRFRFAPAEAPDRGGFVVDLWDGPTGFADCTVRATFASGAVRTWTCNARARSRLVLSLGARTAEGLAEIEVRAPFEVRALAAAPRFR